MERRALQASGSGSTGGAAPVRKSSKRATLSCMECRRLKLRCDRAVPCSSCVKRNLAHLCPDGQLAPTRTSKLSASATALAERVELLEELLRANGLEKSIPPLPDAANLGIDMASKKRRGSEVGMSGAGDGREKGEGRKDGTDDELELIKVGVGSLTIRDDGSSRFLGTSAAMAYRPEAREGTLSASSAAGTSPKPPALPGEDDIASPTFPFPATHMSLESIQAALPEKEEVVRLSKLYFDNCSFMFCPIVPTDYWTDYLPSAFPPSTPHGPKLACVCMALSLGSNFDPDVPPGANSPGGTNSQFYFDLGQQALAGSRFLSHLAVVQALHLCGNILFNRQKLQESGEGFFPLLGVGIKGAQTMGLHRDPEAWGLSAEETHRRRLAFWELFTLDRLQAFLSGRPYTILVAHTDTQMPTDASDVSKEKWKLAVFLGEAIDSLWSVKSPSYTTVMSMDQKLRRLYCDSPPSSRSEALPPSAFSGPGSPPLPSPARKVKQPERGEAIKRAMERDTYGMTYSAVLFYMHKAPFVQALERFPDEPLKSPFAASVKIVVIEVAAYILRIAKHWMALDPVLSPRWWHMSFHLFVAGVSLASFVIRSPRSMLAPRAWDQLNETLQIFETSGGQPGTPGHLLRPQLRTFQQKAYAALTSAADLHHPLGAAAIDEKDRIAASDLLSLGTTTQLARSGPKLERQSSADEKPEVRKLPPSPTKIVETRSFPSLPVDTNTSALPLPPVHNSYIPYPSFPQQPALASSSSLHFSPPPLADSTTSYDYRHALPALHSGAAAAVQQYPAYPAPFAYPLSPIPPTPQSASHPIPQPPPPPSTYTPYAALPQAAYELTQSAAWNGLNRGGAAGEENGAAGKDGPNEVDWGWRAGTTSQNEQQPEWFGATDGVNGGTGGANGSSASRPAPPNEVWFDMLEQENLGYIDLKRFGRVCKHFHKLEQDKALDHVLFRAPPPDPPVNQGQSVRFHPALDLANLVCTTVEEATFFVSLPKAKNKEASPPKSGSNNDEPPESGSNDDEKNETVFVPITRYSCIYDFATFPAATSVSIRKGSNLIASNPSGVTVLDVVKRVVKMWTSVVPEEVRYSAMMSLGEEEMEWKGVSFETIRWRDTLGDHCFCEGMEMVQAVRENYVRLTPRWFGS
ncbi:hypothetical protein JCM8547_002186 [Rhodosporidiobolus lusitaniae]